MIGFKKNKRNLMLSLGLFSLFASSQAIAAGTLVYCMEASPDGFNPQIVTSGSSMDASSVPIYNRLVEFKLGTTETVPGLAKSWDVSEDGKIYM